MQNACPSFKDFAGRKPSANLPTYLALQFLIAPFDDARSHPNFPQNNGYAFHCRQSSKLASQETAARGSIQAVQKVQLSFVIGRIFCGLLCFRFCWLSP